MSVMEKGIIVRDEEIIKSKLNGNIIYKMEEEDKVPKNGTIALVISEGVDIGVKANDIRNNMSYYENEYRRNKDKVDKIDANIRSEIYKENEKNIKSIEKLNNVIRAELLKKEKILMIGRTEISKEVAEGKVGEINSKASGIVSYHIDGFEEIYTHEQISNIGLKEIDKKYKMDVLGQIRSVEADDTIAKVVKSNTWYLVFEIENEKIKEIKEKTYHKTYVMNNGKPKEIYFFVDRIEKDAEKSKVVFRSTKYVQEYLKSRTLEFKLHNEVYKGYKIPTSTIVDKEVLIIKKGFYNMKDEHTYILLKKMGERKVELEINAYMKNNGDIYILENENKVNEGDLLENEDGNIYQIKRGKIKGVYATNYGFTTFKEITINESISKELGITILNVKDNKHIRRYDTIAKNGNEITENEKIGR